MSITHHGPLGVSLAVVLTTLATIGRGAERLQFEAEDCVVNRDAVLLDKSAPNRWMLWTKDADAQRKWSGGAVLKSPEVKADRATPEDGAPPLHLLLKGIAPGTYDVRIKRGRALAVSLDGQQWQRLEGDLVAGGVNITAGTFEFWVDDRYAEIKPQGRGASYVDCIYVEPAAPLVNGVWNGDLEMLAEGQPVAWSLPKPTDAVTVDVARDAAHSGKHALHVLSRADEGSSWGCVCRKAVPVTPGTALRLSVWARGTIERAASLVADGVAESEPGKRLVGQAVLGEAAQWTCFSGYFDVPPGVTALNLTLRGAGRTDLLIDDIAIELAARPQTASVKVQGWAQRRVEERLDRGVVALRTPQGAYVSWRLLQSDPATVGFAVLRSVEGGPETAVTGSPVTQTCDIVDRDAPAEGRVVYRVVPQGGVLPVGTAQLAPRVEGTPHLKIRLKDPTLVANRLAVADLDGDGAYDFVLKHPNQSTDPAGMYWKRSADTYKLDAYTSRGDFLWRRDLGWSIELGIWYSPFIACDLDGDGRAEIIAKTGEGDPRDPDGKVTKGPEWLTVIDGRTGQDICRAPWPSRQGFENYNLASRNQLAVAYLDGRTPCLLALRGTYSRMKVDAYVLQQRALKKVWSYDNAAWPTAYWGQGAHTTRVADVDGDGRDELILGSACLDDDGRALWTTGRGHPDGVHVGHFQFGRPGMQVFYCLETFQTVDGGLCMVNAADGKSIWALGGPTRHVHSSGMCADLDPTVPGCEGYGSDTDEKKRANRAWLTAADGRMLATGTRYNYTQPTIYWDADLQREVFRDRIYDHDGGVLEARPERGKVVDLWGDWREEIIASVPGELRIYSTTLPAMDRRVCLMQDPIYRSYVTMSSMGYETSSTLLTSPAATARNLNLTCVGGEEHPACRVVVSTPPTAGLTGTLVLRTEGPFKLATERLPVKLGPGELLTQSIDLVGLPQGKPAQGRIVAELTTPHDVLRGEVWCELTGRVVPRNFLVDAGALAEQQGGPVRVGALGGGGPRAISQWDQKGQRLQWTVEVPAAGRYQLLMRYHAGEKVARRLWINDVDCGPISFLPTRGTGQHRDDWDEVTFVDAEGKPFPLERGRQTLRLENIDGHGLDLDYLGFTR